jgi:hypothetical protein
MLTPGACRRQRNEANQMHGSTSRRFDACRTDGDAMRGRIGPAWHQSDPGQNRERMGVFDFTALFLGSGI